MTKNETQQILAIVKAAYPSFARGLTKQDKKATVMVWASAFAVYPYYIVQIAVQKIIATNTFAPSVSEIKSAIKSLYFEAWMPLDRHKRGIDILNEEERIFYEGIIRYTEPLQTRKTCEPTLKEIADQYFKKQIQ